MFVRRLLLLQRYLKVGSLNRRILNNLRWKSNCTEVSDAELNGVKKKEIIDESALPPEPTYCCNTGCSNCVWIKYAQEVTQLFDNGDEIARKKISEKVTDPKLKAFLFTQLGLQEGQEKK